MLVDFLPLGTIHDPTEDPPGSVDPLGTAAGAEQLADVLFPGFTARMWRARFLTFAAVASRESCIYCHARDRLPEEACRRLALEAGRAVDGSTITMPDTKANQAEYPQVRGQRPGCGFPIARLVDGLRIDVGWSH